MRYKNYNKEQILNLLNQSYSMQQFMLLSGIKSLDKRDFRLKFNDWFDIDVKKIIDDNKIRKEKLKEQAKNDAIVECEFCHNKFRYGDHPSNNKNNHNFCCDEHKNFYIASFAKNKTKECVCVDCGCIVIVDKHVSPNHVRCNACSIKYKKKQTIQII